MRSREDIETQTEALRLRFLEGEFTETVLSASFFALGYRGNDLQSRIREIAEDKHDRQRIFQTGNRPR